MPQGVAVTMEGKHLTLLLVLIIVLMLLLVASLALIVWLLLKFQKENLPEAASPSSPAQADGESHCPLHPDKPTSGKCAMCEKDFCSQCLFSQNGPLFCRQHLNLYLSTTWAELGEVKTNAMTPHTAEHIYQTKKILLEKDDIPSFILTNYKINTETDTIESYVCLCVPEKNQGEVLQMLRKTMGTNFSL